MITCFPESSSLIIDSNHIFRRQCLAIDRRYVHPISIASSRSPGEIVDVLFSVGIVLLFPWFGRHVFVLFTRCFLTGLCELTD